MSRDSSYDWQGFYGATSSFDTDLFIAGPQDTNLFAPSWVYDAEGLTTDKAGNLVRSIGEVSWFVGDNTSSGNLRLVWSVRWVTNVELATNPDPYDERSFSALSDDQILAFGSLDIYLDGTGIVNFAGGAQGTWDTSSERKGDDVAGLLFSYDVVNSGIAPNAQLAIRGRNLFRKP